MHDFIKPFMQVNEKGAITFENFQIIGTPSSLHFTFLQMIAPFWADVDARGTGSVFFRQTTNPNLLARATNEVKSSFLASSNTTIKSLFIATWNAVGYYSQHTDKVHVCIYIRTYVMNVSCITRRGKYLTDIAS